MVDITILTEKRYVQPSEITPYIQNILDEFEYLRDALVGLGLTVNRISWDDPNYDWSTTRAVVFRTIWDYFERYDEFMKWIKTVQHKTILINPLSLIEWNIDKHYLRDLEQRGIAIVKTHYVDTGDYQSLVDVCNSQNWKDIVIKPAISGAAFHTYKIMNQDIVSKEDLFESLVAERDMLVQEYLPTITTRGEASLMVFDGKYTHAIIKKAKSGDFRVQDDFGGTVHPYQPTQNEIDFAVKVFHSCDPVPAYGRADIVWNEAGNILLSELEIIEPELWVRNYPPAAIPFAEGIKRLLNAEET